MVEPERPQTTIRRMRFAYWITKATDTKNMSCDNNGRTHITRYINPKDVRMKLGSLNNSEFFGFSSIVAGPMNQRVTKQDAVLDPHTLPWNHAVQSA